MREQRYSSTNFDLSTVGVVSFMLLPLYPWRNRPRYPLDRSLGGSQSLSGGNEDEKNLAATGN
jgi:hypothetical protein